MDAQSTSRRAWARGPQRTDQTGALRRSPQHIRWGGQVGKVLETSVRTGGVVWNCDPAKSCRGTTGIMFDAKQGVRGSLSTLTVRRPAPR
mgnify:FL=1